MSEALTESTQENIWPLPKFYFTVNWGAMTGISFQEITGMENESIGPWDSTIKMPGIAKVGNVTIKHGIFVKDNAFWDWYQQVKMNTIVRENIVIKLLDEKGNPTMMWTLNNAWPTKISGVDSKSDGNEVAVESIDIAYETIIIAAP